jgi:hypothetical protein
MAEAPEPLVKLEPGGVAPIVRYNLPEPTIYTGRNFIELDYANDFFTQKAFEKPPPEKRTPVKGLDFNTLKQAVENGMATSFADSKLFPNIRLGTTALRFVTKSNPGLQVASDLPISPKLAQLDANEVATMMQAGRRLNIYTTMFGTLTHNYITDPAEAKREPRPQLLLVETYRLSSFLGTYGAGRIVKTFTLLPGEKTKVSVRTFLKTEEQRKQASSILDSFTQESASDFESTIAEEQTDKETYEENFEYYAEAQAKASWGWGSAKVKAGVKGGSNSAREEFSKNARSSIAKHAMKTSAKRDVEINTSYEVSETEEQETSIEREIENINLSRTMNFVFRQMNQEFITVLSLVDVRLAFFNGFAETRREVTLPELDTLLEEYIVEDKRPQVANDIIVALENILDYKDDLQSIVEKKVIDAGNEYFRIKKDIVSTHTDAITGTQVTVPGIILSVMTNVLRTEGVIVEAILGVGDALDAYATRLQELEVARREAVVAGEAAKAETTRLLNQVVRDNDPDRARLLVELTCPCGPKLDALDINLNHQDVPAPAVSPKTDGDTP